MRRTLILLASVLLGAVPAVGAAESTVSLPLSKVVLYSSGVGYFQHDGTVQDAGHLDLRFNVSQINDVLKSLVVQDFNGGQVGAVRYSARDPLAKTLGSFGVDLTHQPTLGQLLQQLRGEHVEIATPSLVTGIIVGVEKRTELVGDGGRRTIEVDSLTLLTFEGLGTYALPQVQRVRLLNERLNGELEQALRVLATGHDTQKKTVSIGFDGQGTRRVRVAYLTETPVWKTAYRLVLEDERPAFLQGWALVENTSESDWSNVKLSLVSGRPISFVMDLYQPLYNPRPVVVPELHAALKPQVHGGVMDSGEHAVAAAPEGAGEAALSGMGKGPGSLRRATSAKSQAMAADVAEAVEAKDDRLNLAQGVAAQATGQETGEVFEYSLAMPVTVLRQGAAMLPIIGQEIQGEKVSIFNAATHPKHPLHGVRLKNTTPVYLTQGPITVFDGGAYAGDAQIEDVPPGQDRLISYALDLKTEVEIQHDPLQQELVSVAIRKGTLVATRRASEEHIYRLKNRDRKARSVLVEHPYRADWELVEPAKALERTREVYRFAVVVPADQSLQLRVRETKQLQETVWLMDSGSETIAYYLQAKQVGAKVKEVLQKTAALRDRLTQTSAQRVGLEQRIKDIGDEQGRIRENMGRVSASSELYSRYVKKLDQQETDIEKLRRDLELVKKTDEEQRKELNHYLMNVEVG